MRLPPIRATFRQQIVGLTAAVTASAVALLTVLVWFVLGQITSRDLDLVLQDRAASVIEGIRTEGPSFVVPSDRLDAGVAVYDGQGRLVDGSPPQALAEVYQRLSTAPKTVVTKFGEDTRLRAEPFAIHNGAQGVVVVSEDLGPYGEAQRLALIVTIATGALTVAAAAGIAAWATRRALRPVAEMARTATEWSEQDLNSRFNLGPPVNELTALGVTLDRLLDRVSSAIRSEQRLTSELAHELRTPLTSVQGTAELLLLRGQLAGNDRSDVEEISAAAQRMADTITTLLELARNAAQLVESGHCSLRSVVDEVVDSLDTGAVRLTADVDDVRLDLPRELAVRTVSPVVENALRFAESSVQLSSDLSEQGVVTLLVDDDGPGPDDHEGDHIFEPGTSSPGSSGAGLGLAIARRIARSVGGDVTLAPRTTGHTRFVIRLPRA